MAYKKSYMLPVGNRVGTMKDSSNLQTVSMGLKTEFETAVIDYTKRLQKVLNGETFFGVPLEMPSKNLMDIKSEYIAKAESELKSRGVSRYKSIAKATFEDLLDKILLEIENNEALGK
jgi:hypothetical protein